MTSGKNRNFCTPALALAVILIGASSAYAQKKAAPAAPAKAAPAAKPAAAAAHTATPGKPGGATTTASHGPTTGGSHVTTAGGAHTTTAGAHTTAGGMAGHPGAPGGHTAMAGPAGHAGPAPRGMNTVHTAHGDVDRRADGRPRDFHSGHGVEVHHGLDGHRRVEVERADHSRIVAEHGGRGYVQHPYRYGGREYGRRTYYHDGRVYDRYYGSHYYHGVYVNYYTPAYYYRPAFYGWAYNPWVAPVPYAWGWGGNPWYGYYGFYFTPYPVYPSAAAWLTDYMISVSLAAAYSNAVEAQAQAVAAASGPPPNAAALTPEVKDMISAEVQRQIALENSEAQTAATAAPDPASSSIQRLLTDNVKHVFLVGHELDVVNSVGAECAVSQGDALQLMGPPPPDAPTASLQVLSSKGGIECHRGDTVSVPLADLQEMQNHMRETIDAGMGEMQSKQGSGLPAMPVAARGEPVKASFMTDAPPPDPNVKTELAQQYNDGVAAENQALAQTPGQPASTQEAMAQTPAAAPAPIPAPAGPPTEISLGQTIDQVTAALGTPVRVVDLNTKVIYVYKDMKITFKGGKVSDVQ